jgi:hypothetical protein
VRVVENVVLYFKHGIQDIIPYSNAVGRFRKILSESQAGEYVEDDMAIDGGDAEALFRGPSADAIFENIAPVLKELPFMRGAKVTLVYGALGSGAAETTIDLED